MMEQEMRALTRPRSRPVYGEDALPGEQPSDKGVFWPTILHNADVICVQPSLERASLPEKAKQEAQPLRRGLGTRRKRGKVRDSTA